MLRKRMLLVTRSLDRLRSTSLFLCDSLWLCYLRSTQEEPELGQSLMFILRSSSVLPFIVQRTLRMILIAIGQLLMILKEKHTKLELNSSSRVVIWPDLATSFFKKIVQLTHQLMEDQEWEVNQSMPQWSQTLLHCLNLLLLWPVIRKW